MSYDLLVFDPDTPPSDREGFMAWYDKQTQWSEDHSDDDSAVSTASLRNWFLDIIKLFPPMNGPMASDDVDDPKITDYSVSKTVVYAAFAWSEAKDAYETVFALAKKHGVGFFDVSSDSGEVWLPTVDGEFVVKHHE